MFRTYIHTRCPAPALILLFLICSSCSPKVLSFSAHPCTTITDEDSVSFTWQVHGTPTLMFYEEDAGDDENPGKRYLYYKLVSHRGKKETTFPTLALTILKDTSVDYIVINTVRSGDSAVASAARDTLEWGRHFILDSVASNSGRSLTVTHLGKTAELDQEGHMSAALKGLPNSGLWEISTLLSGKEKKDTALIPGRLMIKTIIIHQ